MNDVKLHRLLLSVDPMFARMVEVELDEMKFLSAKNDELPLVGPELDMNAMCVLVDVPVG
jgi:hypothetical protein